MVAAAAARALDAHGHPTAVRAADGDLDVALAGAQGGEAGDALEARGGDDLDADRAALAVAQLERVGAAVDGDDGALVGPRRGRSGGGEQREGGHGGDGECRDESHALSLPGAAGTPRQPQAKLWPNMLSPALFRCMPVSRVGECPAW